MAVIPRTGSGSGFNWLPVALAAALLIVAPALAALLLWAIDVDVPLALGIAGLLVVALGFMLVLLTALSGVYGAGAESSRDAFGLPDGSIRALIALAVLIAFLALSVFILADVLDGDQQDAAAQQVLGTVGTLLAAVAAFYFGTNSVKSGASALAALAATTTTPGPEAITKGSAAEAKSMELVGNVNPHGRGTQWYFDYSDEASPQPPPTYPSQTAVRTLDAGEDAVEVRETVSPPLRQGAWFRLRAFNEAGMSTGRDQQVGGR